MQVIDMLAAPDNPPRDIWLDEVTFYITSAGKLNALLKRLFEFSSEDFIECAGRWDDSPPHFSQFDTELCMRWDNAMENGLFRYKLTDLKRRVIMGKNRYVAELNVKRFSERRTPQPAQSVNQPFDPTIFNFNKIKEHEILLKLSRKRMATGGTNDNETQEDNGLVIINVSPLAYGHVLLVPDPLACRPQVLTEMAITLAIETILLSSHRGFRVGFNSMCAMASVNHLHLHAYYMDEELLTEHCEVKHFVGECWEVSCLPVPGFALQLYKSDVSRLSRVTHALTSYLTRENIAHNVFFTRGLRFGEDRRTEDGTVRVFIWPRREVVGEESEDFEAMTEAGVEEVLREVRLTEDQFKQIRINLKEVMGCL